MSIQYNTLLIASLRQPLTEERNLVLLRAIEAGDTVARDEMIAGNMALVIGKVESFISCIPAVDYLRDDLVSAGFVGLTKAVNKIAAGTSVDNVFNYMLTAVDRELGELIDQEHAIRVPGKSRRVAKANGTPLLRPVCVNVLPEQFASTLHEEELEFRDFLNACCCCDEERTFAAMKEAGYTLMEIAHAINMPVSSTYALGKELEERVDRKRKAL